MQRIRTGTSIGIGVIIGVYARGCVSFTVTLCPSITVTDGSVENIVSTMEECQMHDDRTVTTCGIGEYMGIITALRNTHMLIPVKSVTSGFRHMRGIGMQRKSYRHRIVGSIAFGLLSAVLGDTCTRTVHCNHQTVYIRETTQCTKRYSEISPCTTIHGQTFVYRICTDGIPAKCVSKNRNEIR